MTLTNALGGVELDKRASPLAGPGGNVFVLVAYLRDKQLCVYSIQV